MVLQVINVLRMALFPLSYGMIGALMGSTLNRVMIADIGFSVLWVGLFFALPDLVAPVRVWLGYRSDGYPLAGRRREPYIMLGALVVGLAAVSGHLAGDHRLGEQRRPLTGDRVHVYRLRYWPQPGPQLVAGVVVRPLPGPGTLAGDDRL